MKARSKASSKRNDPGLPALPTLDQVASPSPDADQLPRPYKPEGKIHLHYPKELKFHVTLEALREKIPQAEIGAAYGVPQSLISIWKQAAVEAIRENIHGKQRKRRRALVTPEDPTTEEAGSVPVQAETVRNFCRLLRGAARQLEQNPDAVEQLVRQGSFE